MCSLAVVATTPWHTATCPGVQLTLLGVLTVLKEGLPAWRWWQHEPNTQPHQPSPAGSDGGLKLALHFHVMLRKQSLHLWASSARRCYLWQWPKWLHFLCRPIQCQCGESGPVAVVVLPEVALGTLSIGCVTPGRTEENHNISGQTCRIL